MGVAFAPCADKFHFIVAPFHLSGSEIAEYRQMAFSMQLLGKGFSHFDAIANHNHINVTRWSSQENVANISTNNVTFKSF